MVKLVSLRQRRLEFVTGYGVLDRFGITGGTVFFQAACSCSSDWNLPHPLPAN
jgi:hypothetical protein